MKILFPVLLIIFINCYSTEKKYTYGKPLSIQPELEFSESDPQFESGEPYAVIDWIGWFLGFLPKLILFNTKLENHNISEKTKDYLKLYIEENNLKDVKVRFNQYAPFSDFGRLWRSKKVNPILKWTFGFLTWIQLTIFPERVFAGFPFIGGGDHYNPYTNTINVYSDHVGVVVHEGGHAKDFSMREYKSWYSFWRGVPILGSFLSLYQEARATDDAIRYFHHKCDLIAEVEGYKILIPAFGTYVVGATQTGLVGSFTWPSHIWGQNKSKKVLLKGLDEECKAKEEKEEKEKNK
jgi:hypothetical protein